MKALAIVAIGGIAGSLTRYLVTEFLPSYPIAILIANLFGVSIAGIVAFRLIPTNTQKLFWIPGFSGGLTTFSSVSVIHAETSNVLSITYFFGTIACSLIILYFISPKVSK